MSYDETNNRAYIRGKVATEPVFSHEVFGEAFYETAVKTPRLSSEEDVIPVTISERLLSTTDFSVGATVTLFGQFRSYNKAVGVKSKLVLTLFVREVLSNDESKNPNMIYLSGFICKPSVYRLTPFNREIADILLAVNRSYNKSDYIPCIAWGRNARFCKEFPVGEKLAIEGRIQSRKYVKKFDETLQEEKTAYEISVSKLSVGDNISLLEEEADAFFPQKELTLSENYFLA